MHFAASLAKILKWCSIIATTPWYDAKLGRFMVNKTYICAFNIVLLVLYIFLVWRIIEAQIFVVLEIGYFTLLAFTVLLQNINLTYCNFLRFSQFFTEVEKLDLVLRECGYTIYSGKMYNLEFLFANVLIFMINNGGRYSRGVNSILEAAGMLQCFYEYSFAIQFNFQMIILHGVYARSKSVRRFFASCQQTKLQDFKCDWISKASFMQRRLAKMVELYNRLFGWKTFLHLFVTYVGILFLIYLCLTIGAFLGTLYIIVFSTATVFVLIFLSIEGQAICNDSEEIASVCSNFLACSKRTYSHNRIKDLVQQVSVKKLRISAAGFFDVDYSMLFMLLNLLVTYVIALIQFIPA